VEQASPHCESGLGPAHGGGKVSGRAIAISCRKQRSVAAALTGENRGGGEHWRRWPVKGNGSEEGVACLPTDDDGGGDLDRGGATMGGGGRRQLDGFISQMEIDVMTCDGQVGDATQQAGPAEESATDRWARSQTISN
jgi:hypothetical protein